MRKEASGPKPIRDAIRQFFRESGLQRPQTHERAFRAWIEAAGPRWELRAVPVAFRAGRLTVEVDSSVHLQELRNFRGEGYRRRANTILGQERIRELAFKLKG